MPAQDAKPQSLQRRHTDSHRGVRLRQVRAATLHPRGLWRDEIELGYKLWPKTDHGRPQTRLECANGTRPCPFVSCRYHLFLDVDRKGAIKFNFPDLEVWELPSTCALDVADRGPVALDEVADLMNLTREAVRLIELRAESTIASREPRMVQML